MKNIQMVFMNKIINYLASFTVIACVLFPILPAAADVTQGSSASSDGKYFRITYISKIEPLPLNQIHSWVLHVETLDRKPVENAAIAVYGGMPAHKHGLPTEPRVTETGGGDYLVEGIKFSMSGQWQMWFKIRAVDLEDEIKFDIVF